MGISQRCAAFYEYQITDMMFSDKNVARQQSLPGNSSF